MSGLARYGRAVGACIGVFLSFSVAAFAQSCEDVDATWGSGVTLNGPLDELWFEVNLSTGETLTYTVSSSGSTNTSNNIYSGAGFALYSYTANPPPNNVILEKLAWSGEEVAFGPGATYTASESGPYVIYAWAGAADATINAQVTCMLAVPAPAITTPPTNETVTIGNDTTFTVAASNASDYQWQFNSGSGFQNIANGGVYSGATTSTLTITGATAAMNGYMYRAVASGPTAPSATSTPATLTVNKQTQSITFDNPGTQTFGTSPTLSATASSSLAVSFSSATTSVCTTTTAGELSFVSAGTCTINANQAGDATFGAAPQVQQSFAVDAIAPGAPTGIAVTPGNEQAMVGFAAPASNGGAAISLYTVTASPGGATGTGASSPIPVAGLSNGTVYTFTVSATNSAGTGPQSEPSGTITPRASQTVTFIQPADMTFGSTPTLAASASSGLDVTFSSSTTGVCTISAQGRLAFAATGVCTINAAQSGNAAFRAASTVSRSFTVLATVPAEPTIGTAVAGNGEAAVTFTAPASTGGAPITGYTVTSTPGGFTGTGHSSPITVTGLTNGQTYTFTVTATNSSGPGPASSASNQVTPAAPQSITFGNPGTQNFGTSPTLSATASSTLPVSFSSFTTGVCTIDVGGTLAFVAAGTCTIAANQLGNAEFEAAPEVAQSFTVAAVAPGAPVIGTATAGDGEASVAFSPPASTGGIAITGYTVTSNPGGFTGTGTASPIMVDGLTNGVAYTFTVTATNVAGTGDPSQPSNSITPAMPQAITFSDPGTQTFGTTPQLTATSDSLLTVVFSSSTPAVCTTTSDGELAFVAAGSCIINADQAGDSSFLPAPRVSHTFSVTAIAPDAPVIGIAVAGDTQASVAFTAPASTGGSPVTTYTVTSSPGNVTATGAASPITVAGLQNDTAYTFTVTATTIAGDSDPSSPSNSVTPVPTTLPPVVGAVSATVAANSTDNPITLDVTSDAPATMSITTPPSHGTATASGQSITYTPTAGYFGADAFAYAATNSAGTSTSAVVTITVTAPPAIPSIASITPAEKMVTDNMVYATITGTGLSSTQSVVFGAVHGSNLTIVSDTEISIMTPHNLPGVYDVTVNTAHGSVTSPAAFTVNAPLSSPTISLAASDDNPAFGASVTFTATLAGGASPTGTVTFKDGKTKLGTGTVTGTTATLATDALGVGTHSIIAEYGGDAGNATAISAAITVIVGQGAPSVALSASDKKSALGEKVTFTAKLAGGDTPTGTVTFMDGTATLGTATISGTTATFATDALAVGAHSITAEYGGDADNAAAVSAAVAVTVGKVAPAVSLSASDSEPAFGSSVVFTATLADGASPTGSVTFKDGKKNLGTGTVSGTTATFATDALAVGAHSITAEYGGDADNAKAVSDAVTVTVAPPVFVFSPAPGALPAGTVTVAYSETISASAQGIAAPPRYKVSSGKLPAGMRLDRATGIVAGTPSRAGDFAFTIRATDGATSRYSAEASYSITVKPAVVFAFTPARGALAAAMAGEEYSQAISARGGSGALTYRLQSGTLPKGMVLNVSTGELTGPLAEDAEVKDYTFTIEVRDGDGMTGTATYMLEVEERTVTVENKQIEVPAGTVPANVDLTNGATGGPFVSANIVTVEPANAGTVTVVRGEFAQVGDPDELGWYLKFVPNPAYSGQVSVRYRLTSALGISNAGTVVYLLTHDAGQVAADVDGLVHGFVRSRQNLIASTIEVPGLLERRQMAAATDPLTARLTPSESGVTTSFSTSLAQMNAAAGTAETGHVATFNVWIDGTFMLHNRDQNGSEWGSFGMVSAGADYLLSEKALIGLSIHLDRMTDPTDADAELTGNGWLAGPYASLEIGKGVFWDTSLLYGGSANDIDTAYWDGTFDTRRWLFDTSISGQWRFGEATIITPKLRAVYFSETVDDYGVENGDGDLVGIEGFTEEQLRVSFGAEIARQFMLENGMTVTPKLGLTGGFAGLDGSGAFGQVSAGVAVDTPTGWNFDFGLRSNMGGDGERSVGARAGVSKRF
jgi:hypothetical protein